MSSPAPQKIVRLVITMYPKPGVSDEEFHQYWEHEHSKVFTSVGIVRRHVSRYEQVHASSEIAEGLPNVLKAKLSPIKGMAIVEADSVEKILAIFSDEEFQTRVVPDEARFMDRENAQLIFSYVHTFIDNPSAVGPAEDSSKDARGQGWWGLGKWL